MKKFIFSLFALLISFVSVSFADVQIDEGQSKSTAAKKFFVARNSMASTAISKDQVVVWDAISKDGVSVRTTTTSADGLVAGIALDNIPAASDDNTAAVDESNPNWGRIQTWGLYDNALIAGGNSFASGARLCASGTAGRLSACTTSTDGTQVGVALETGTGASGTVDLFVRID